MIKIKKAIQLRMAFYKLFRKVNYSLPSYLEPMCLISVLLF